MKEEMKKEVLEWYENKEDTLFVIVILVMLNCNYFSYLCHIFYIDLFASIKAISEGEIKGCGILTSMVPYVLSSLLSLFYLRLILKKSRVLREG